MTYVAAKGRRRLLFGAYFAIRQFAQDSRLVFSIVCIVNRLLPGKTGRDHGKPYAFLLCHQDMSFNASSFRERGVLRLRRKQDTKIAGCIVIFLPGIVLPGERKRQKDQQPAAFMHWGVSLSDWFEFIVLQFSHGLRERRKKLQRCAFISGNQRLECGFVVYPRRCTLFSFTPKRGASL